MKELTYKEMQELLPDYVLKRLAPENRTAFERNLHKYPGLKEEAEDAKKLFERINKTDFDKVLSDKTKNMSYKVHKRMQRETRKNPQFLTKFVFPSIGLVTVIVLLFFTADPSKLFKESEFAPESRAENFLTDDLLNDEEVLSIIENDTQLFVAAGPNDDFLENNELTEDIYKEEEIEIILNMNLSEESGYDENISSYEMMNYLSEEEFQEIYEEMKNVELF